MIQLMFCLVGQQPVPNLLPILHFKPKEVVLVNTESTLSTSEKLEKLLHKKCDVTTLKVDPYDISTIHHKVERFFAKTHEKEDLLFNITGGTKPMVLGSFLLAQRLRMPIIYLQSDRLQGRIYLYSFNGQQLILHEEKVLEELLTINDFLQVHVGDYSQRRRKDPFSKIIKEAIEPYVSEVLTDVSIGANVDLDLVLRSKNQMGVVEVTTTKNKIKRKIDQLTAATERDSLGTYTHRFLIINQRVDENNQKLAKENSITLIEILKSSRDRLADGDRELLTKKVRESLGKGSRELG